MKSNSKKKKAAPLKIKIIATVAAACFVVCAVIAAVGFSTLFYHDQPLYGTEEVQIEKPSVSFGPGGGGNMHTPAINPQDGNNIFIACDMSSNYTSRDGGKSFQSVNLWSAGRWFFTPHDKNTVYATMSTLSGMSHPMIFVSHDRGETFDHFWPKKEDIAGVVSGYYTVPQIKSEATAANFRRPNGPVISVYADPGDRNAVYALTQSGSAAAGSGTSIIYVTRDGGNTWAEFGRLPGAAIQFDNYDPANRIYGDSYTGGGLTHNYGARMEIVGNELYVMSVKGFYRYNLQTGERLSEHDVDLVSIGVDWVIGNDKITVYSIRAVSNDSNYARHIYQSTDFGKTWTSITTDFKTKAKDMRQGTTILPERKINFRYVAASGNGTLYASFDGGHWDTNGIARSDDGGVTWDWVFRTIAHGGSLQDMFTNLGPQEAWDGNLAYNGIARITVSKSDPNHAIAISAMDVFQTRDGGVTWAALSSKRVDEGSMTVGWPADRDKAFWTTSGIEPTGASDIAIDPFDSNHRFMTSNDVGLYESFDGGKSWRRRSITGSNGMSVAFDPHNRGVVLAMNAEFHGGGYAVGSNNYENVISAQWGGHGWVSRSADGGTTWSTIPHGSEPHAQNDFSCEYRNGLPCSLFPQNIVWDPNPQKPGESTVYISGDCVGVYKSTDGGVNWTPHNTGIQQAASATPVWTTRLLQLSNDGKTLFVLMKPSTSSPNLSLAYELDLTAANAAWKPLNLPKPKGKLIPANSISMAKDGALYTAPYNHTNVGGTVDFNGASISPYDVGGAYKSLDHGATWTQIYDELIEVGTIHVDTRDDNKVYMGTYVGKILYSYKGKDTVVTDWKATDMGYKNIGCMHYAGGKGIYEDPADTNIILVSSGGGGNWTVELNKTMITVTKPVTFGYGNILRPGRLAAALISTFAGLGIIALCIVALYLRKKRLATQSANRGGASRNTGGRADQSPKQSANRSLSRGTRQSEKPTVKQSARPVPKPSANPVKPEVRPPTNSAIKPSASRQTERPSAKPAARSLPQKPQAPKPPSAPGIKPADKPVQKKPPKK